jgi:hypothetical protein
VSYFTHLLSQDSLSTSLALPQVDAVGTSNSTNRGGVKGGPSTSGSFSPSPPPSSISRRSAFLNTQMGSETNASTRSSIAWASDFRMSGSNHRQFYRRWAELIAGAGGVHWPGKSPGHRFRDRTFADSLLEEGVSSEPVSESPVPASRELTGNFIDSGLGGASMAPKKRV